MSTATQASTEIRPFEIDHPEEKIDDLRRRIAATRWPCKELVDDRSQGVQLAAVKALGDCRRRHTSSRRRLGCRPSGRAAKADPRRLDCRQRNRP
jgi:hypothetical protein